MVSIPVWFSLDTGLRSLFAHLDTPQCFSAEMYSADLHVAGKPEDDKIAVDILFYDVFVFAVKPTKDGKDMEFTLVT
ncbi:hypothetical protein Tsubulata_023942 [Turnera subulata]|uniref:Uncharacterized protein n=1 Tax=Turnera subulata TaxID=218843 RepID=A0A9Q0FWH8_9ROSI|nr:hypothetical protein Tsubulata_023942 [Turnera subulata]